MNKSIKTAIKIAKKIKEKREKMNSDKVKYSMW